MSRGKHYADLLYKRKQHELGNMEESPEFVIRIDPDEFRRWRAHKTEVPIVQVVDSMDVFISSTRGHTGQLLRPSHDLLLETFGSTKFEDVFDFMAVNGRVHVPTKGGALEGREKGAYLKNESTTWPGM